MLPEHSALRVPGPRPGPRHTSPRPAYVDTYRNRRADGTRYAAPLPPGSVEKLQELAGMDDLLTREESEGVLAVDRRDEIGQDVMQGLRAGDDRCAAGAAPACPGRVFQQLSSRELWRVHSRVRRRFLPAMPIRSGWEALTSGRIGY
jgi:hypothetical protein